MQPVDKVLIQEKNTDNAALAEERKKQSRLQTLFKVSVGAGNLGLFASLVLMMASNVNFTGTVNGEKVTHKAEDAQPYYYATLATSVLLMLGGMSGYTRSTSKIRDIDKNLENNEKKQTVQDIKPR